MRRAKKWLLAIAAAHVALIVLGIIACIPETGLDRNIVVADGNRPIFTVPTTAPIAHYKRSGPRYIEMWAGRVDQPRLQDWVDEFDSPDPARRADPWEVTEEWADGITAMLPADLRSGPFITKGDLVRRYDDADDRWIIELQVNETTGTFFLMRYIVDDAD